MSDKEYRVVGSRGEQIKISKVKSNYLSKKATFALADVERAIYNLLELRAEVLKRELTHPRAVLDQNVLELVANATKSAHARFEKNHRDSV